MKWNRHAHPLWSTVLILLGKYFPSTLLFFRSFNKDVHQYWERSDNSIADVLMLRWDIPLQNTQLCVSLPIDCWDPLDIIGLPASWAAMDKSFHKSVHPLHDSEFLLVISLLEEGSLYVFGQNANLAAGYIYAEILGNPYSKKSPLPCIGTIPHLPVSPSIPSHQILGQLRILNRISLPYSLSRRAPTE